MPEETTQEEMLKVETQNGDEEKVELKTEANIEGKADVEDHHDR
jgi:hypothetical protein